MPDLENLERSPGEPNAGIPTAFDLRLYIKAQKCVRRTGNSWPRMPRPAPRHETIRISSSPSPLGSGAPERLSPFARASCTIDLRDARRRAGKPLSAPRLAWLRALRAGPAWPCLRFRSDLDSYAAFSLEEATGTADAFPSDSGSLPFRTVPDNCVASRRTSAPWRP